MLKPVFIEILNKLYSRMTSTRIKWAITGSLSHALQGIEIIPNDIDILTDKHGAFSIEQLFSEFVYQQVAFSTKGAIRSFYGVLLIDDIRVDIIGDIENKNERGSWEPHADWDNNIFYLNITNFSVPVLNLEYEYKIYNRLREYERTEILRKKLKLHKPEK